MKKLLFGILLFAFSAISNTSDAQIRQGSVSKFTAMADVEKNSFTTGEIVQYNGSKFTGVSIYSSIDTSDIVFKSKTQTIQGTKTFSSSTIYINSTQGQIGHPTNAYDLKIGGAFTLYNASATLLTKMYLGGGYTWIDPVDQYQFKVVTPSISIENNVGVKWFECTSPGGTGFERLTFGVPVFTAKDVEVTDATKGIILTAPNLTRYRVTVSNAGALVVTAL